MNLLQRTTGQSYSAQADTAGESYAVGAATLLREQLSSQASPS